MSGAKGVKDKDVSVGGELLGNLRVVLLLGLKEADILEDENLAGLQGLHGSLSLLAIGVIDELDVVTRELGELVRRRLE